MHVKHSEKQLRQFKQQIDFELHEGLVVILKKKVTKQKILNPGRIRKENYMSLFNLIAVRVAVRVYLIILYLYIISM